MSEFKLWFKLWCACDLNIFRSWWVRNKKKVEKRQSLRYKNKHKVRKLKVDMKPKICCKIFERVYSISALVHVSVMMNIFNVCMCWKFLILSSFSFYQLYECVRNVTKFHVLLVILLCFNMKLKTDFKYFECVKKPIKTALEQFFSCVFFSSF